MVVAVSGVMAKRGSFKDRMGTSGAWQLLQSHDILDHLMQGK